MPKGDAVKRKPSATDAARVAPHLPSAKDEYVRTQLLVDMFDSTSRAGAGGTKAGLVGIRPRGGRSASAFVDDLTPGKVKPREDKPLEEPKDTGRMRGNVKPTNWVLPRSFCPMCPDARATCRPLEGGQMSMIVIDQDRPHIDYHAFEPIVFFICQECIDDRMKAKRDPAGSLVLPGKDGQLHENRALESWEAHKRMNANLEAYMHYMISADRKQEIWHDTW